MTSHLRYAPAGFLVAALVLAGSLAQPSPADAATACTFTTDLTLGSENDAVKCLQQYLNANGFTVSTSGVGSVGHETTQFRAKTLAAVKAWQTANGITPATGTFGAKSRAKYTALTTPAPVQNPTPTPTPAPTPTPSSDTAAMTNARTIIDAARKSYDTTENDYQNAHEDGDTTGTARTNLSDAKDKLMEALYAYVDGDYADAVSSVKDAQTLINTAADAIDGKAGNGDRASARDAISKAKVDLNSARNKVGDAGDKGKSTARADRYLQSAADALNNAQDTYKTEDYNDAISYVNDAEDSIKKALATI